jgi:hypothetical protein
MEIYLILVMLVLPGPSAPKQELQRHMITASSYSSCQVHADKLAEEQRRLNEAVIRQQGSKVIGRCYAQGVTV